MDLFEIKPHYQSKAGIKVGGCAWNHMGMCGQHVDTSVLIKVHHGKHFVDIRL